MIRDVLLTIRRELDRAGRLPPAEWPVIGPRMAVEADDGELPARNSHL